MDDFADLPLDRLDDEIGELAAHIASATCRWLELIAEVDRREAFAEWGFGSCTAWLAWRCSLSPATARDHVRVARRLRELPLIRDDFANGALTYSKVRAATRVGEGTDEEQLLMLARHATAAQLERVVRAYRGVMSTQFESRDAESGERALSWRWTDTGELEIHGTLPATEGAMVVAALEAARDELRSRPRREPPTAEANPAEVTISDEAASGAPSNADALALMAETMLAGGERDSSGGDRYQVVLHVDRDVLVEDAADGRCEIEHGPALSTEAARRLACDASLVTMIEQNGRPLNVRRRTRTIAAAIRRALRSRDGGCRFPGCAQRRFVDAHHIEHWAHGGETKLSNLVQLCRRHHRLLHEGGFSVEQDASGLTFRRPDGRIVPLVPRPARGEHATLVRQNQRRGVHPGSDTCFPLSAGERIRDFGTAVDSLLPRNAPPSPSQNPSPSPGARPPDGAG